MVVRRLKVFPLESIVRGYITGSGWAEYKRSGTVHGIEMPKGLQESQKLDTPLWTPSTKAELGDKDENISPQKAREIVGEKYAKLIEEYSLKAYEVVCPPPFYFLASVWVIDADEWIGPGLRSVKGDNHRRHQIRVRSG